LLYLNPLGTNTSYLKVEDLSPQPDDVSDPNRAAPVSAPLADNQPPHPVAIANTVFR
jgi:hypothetical protein